MTLVEASNLDGNRRPAGGRQRRPLPGRASVVYALLSSTETPVYVGSSNAPLGRMRSHRHTQPWWHEVAYVTWLRVPSGRLGSGRFEPERAATLALAPRYNQQNNHGAWTAAIFARRRRIELARAAEFPTVRCLRRPVETWVEALDSRTVVRDGRWPVLVVRDGPISQWTHP